jgi:hypothetical protein
VASCSGSPEDLEARLPAPIQGWRVGHEGGILHAEDLHPGLTVVIPPGALLEDTVLTLEVEASGQVHFDPHVTLERAAVVGFSSSSRAPESSETGAIEQGGPPGREPAEPRAWFNVRRLSTFSLSDAATIAEPLGFNDTPWPVRGASARWEPDHVFLPSIDRADVTPDCLVSASDLIEDRHDRPYRLLRLGRQPEEATTMSAEARAAFATARVLMAEVMPGYDLWVNGAWDSSGRIHRANSTHYFGAALDLSLASWTGRSWRKMKPADPSLLGLVPDILRMSGFSWVLFENRRHIHASISSPSLAACAPIAPDPAGWEPLDPSEDRDAEVCADVEETPTLLDCYQALP